MNAEPKLSAAVLKAIHGGQKIDAIKLLRTESGLGLKEAKDVVDAYMDNNAHLVVQRSSSGGAGAIIFVIVVIAAGYVAYRFLA